MAQDQPDVRMMLTRTLLEKIANDPYPSSTMMDMLEELLTPQTVGAYANVLIDKVEADEFPSLDMLKRLQQLS
jgi:hypothetical protein